MLWEFLREAWDHGWFNRPLVLPAWEELSNVDHLFKSFIIRRLKEFKENPITGVKFYIKKTTSLWTDATYQSYFHNRQIHATHIKPEEYTHQKMLKFYDEKRDSHPVLKHFKKHKVEILFNTYSKGIFLIILIYSGTLILFKLLKKEKLTTTETILVLTFIGGYMFTALWEAKSRYVLPYAYILYPLAFISINYFMNKFIKLSDAKIK